MNAHGLPDRSTPEGEEDNLLSWTRDWGLLLRSARQVAGLSLAGLSERTGLSRGYLSKLESGQEGARNPSRATLVALAHALPSFRPLAYQLEPVDSANESVSLAFAEVVPRPPRMLIGTLEGQQAGEGEAVEPIQLGWKELEALVAFLALERSAMPTPISARLIARASDRPVDALIPTLDQLVHSNALTVRPPMRPGADPTYARGPAFEIRLGLSRLGDALVLAAALLARAAPPLRIKRHGEVEDEEMA